MTAAEAYKCLVGNVLQRLLTRKTETSKNFDAYGGWQQPREAGPRELKAAN
jgi:hypothetical protein